MIGCEFHAEQARSRACSACTDLAGFAGETVVNLEHADQVREVTLAMSARGIQCNAPRAHVEVRPLELTFQKRNEVIIDQVIDRFDVNSSRE